MDDFQMMLLIPPASKAIRLLLRIHPVPLELHSQLIGRRLASPVDCSRVVYRYSLGASPLLFSSRDPVPMVAS